MPWLALTLTLTLTVARSQVDTDVVQGVGGVLVTLIALFELYRNWALILELVRAVATALLPARLER